MPSKYPVLTPDEVISILEENGFVYVSQKGSHRKYKKANMWLLFQCITRLQRGR